MKIREWAMIFGSKWTSTRSKRFPESLHYWLYTSFVVYDLKDLPKLKFWHFELLTCTSNIKYHLSSLKSTFIAWQIISWQRKILNAAKKDLHHSITLFILVSPKNANKSKERIALCLKIIEFMIFMSSKTSSKKFKIVLAV